MLGTRTELKTGRDKIEYFSTVDSTRGGLYFMSQRRGQRSRQGQMKSDVSAPWTEFSWHDKASSMNHTSKLYNFLSRETCLIVLIYYEYILVQSQPLASVGDTAGFQLSLMQTHYSSLSETQRNGFSIKRERQIARGGQEGRWSKAQDFHWVDPPSSAPPPRSLSLCLSSRSSN